MLALFIIILSIVIDQSSKYFALSLKNQKDIVIIDSFLNLSYLENRGAALGILRDFPLILNLITMGVTLALCIFLYRHQATLSKWVYVSLSLIIGGALGNLVDRILRGFVVDFISVIFPGGYRFPIFNVADICISLGCLFLVLIGFFTDELNEVL